MSINVQFHQTPDLLQQEQIWVREAKENPARFEPLYRKYYDSILRYLKNRLEDPDQAYDIASQVFIKAMKNISKYEDRGVPFGSWLFRITKSELYQSYRDKQAERLVSVDSVQISSFDVLFFENQESEHHRLLLLKAMQRLKTEQLKLIEMRFFEQLSFKEMSEIIGITENNAKVKTFRALEKLREHFLGKSAA